MATTVLTAAAPVTVSNIQADTYRIVRYLYDVAAKQMVVSWQGGVKQGDGTVKWNCGADQPLDFTTYGAVVPGVSAQTLQTQHEAQIYKAMQDAGVFPAGVIA